MPEYDINIKKDALRLVEYLANIARSENPDEIIPKEFKKDKRIKEKFGEIINKLSLISTFRNALESLNISEKSLDEVREIYEKLPSKDDVDKMSDELAEAWYESLVRALDIVGNLLSSFLFITREKVEEYSRYMSEFMSLRTQYDLQNISTKEKLKHLIEFTNRYRSLIDHFFRVVREKDKFTEVNWEELVKMLYKSLGKVHIIVDYDKGDKTYSAKIIFPNYDISIRVTGRASSFEEAFKRIEELLKD